jgi:O-antigen/teichoic acid export membrane protein
MSTLGLRGLLRHGGVYAGTSTAGAALAFFVLPLYVAYLGPEGLGTVELLAAATSLFTLVVGQGLPSAWFRLRRDYEGLLRRVFETTVLWYLVASALAVIGLSVAIGPPLVARYIPEIPFHPMWLLALATGAATIVCETYARGLQAEHRSTAYAFVVLGRRILTLGAIVAFVVGLGRGVEGKVVAEALVTLIVAVGMIAAVHPLAPTRASGAVLRAALAYGLPLLPHVFAMQIIAVWDRLVINHALGLGAVGVYSLGYRIAAIVEMANVGLAGAYRASFFSHAARLDEPGGLGRAAFAARTARLEHGFLAASGMLALSVSLGTRELLLLARVDPVAFADSWRVTTIVCAGLFAHAGYSILATPIIHATRAIGLLPAVSGLGALVNVVGCVVFIPRYGFLAAAWATVAAHVTIAIGAFFAGQRAMPLPRSFGTWGKLAAATLLAIAVGYQCDAHFATTSWRVGAKLVVATSACLALWLFSGLGRRGGGDAPSPGAASQAR